MNQGLLILGAGQYGKLVKEIAESMNRFDKIDFLDDQSGLSIGAIKDYRSFLNEYNYAFVAIGNSEIRMSLIYKLKDCGFELATIISPSAYVSSSALIMKGTVVEPMSVIQTDSIIGMGCLICSGSVVKHNAVINDACYLDCNCVVMPGANVPSKTKIKAGTIYTANVKTNN